MISLLPDAGGGLPPQKKKVQYQAAEDATPLERMEAVMFAQAQLILELQREQKWMKFREAALHYRLAVLEKKEPPKLPKRKDGQSEDEYVAELFCHALGTTLKEMQGRARTAQRARQREALAAELAKQEWTPERIAAVLHRDRSTVAYLLQKEAE